MDAEKPTPKSDARKLRRDRLKLTRQNAATLRNAQLEENKGRLIGKVTLEAPDAELLQWQLDQSQRKPASGPAVSPFTLWMAVDFVVAKRSAPSARAAAEAVAKRWGITRVMVMKANANHGTQAHALAAMAGIEANIAVMTETFADLGKVDTNQR